MTVEIASAFDTIKEDYASGRFARAFERMIYVEVMQAVEQLRLADIRGAWPFPGTYTSNSSSVHVTSLADWAESQPNLPSKRRAGAVHQLRSAARSLELLEAAQSDGERARMAEAAIVVASMSQQPWPQRRGRPRGEKFLSADLPLLAELEQRVGSGEPISMVALDLARRAEGPGTLESRAKRIVRRRRREKK